MSLFAPRSGLAGASRLTLTAGRVDLHVHDRDRDPERHGRLGTGHDVLMSHVHSGTLGWITLGVAGIAFLMFSEVRDVPAAEQRQVTTMAWTLIGAVVLYVSAFLAGDSIFGDRIQRPIFGTVLFIVVIWLLVWFINAYREYESASAARLGLLLAWISLLIGAIFGVILGLYTSNGNVPGLDDETAARSPMPTRRRWSSATCSWPASPSSNGCSTTTSRGAPASCRCGCCSSLGSSSISRSSPARTSNSQGPPTCS